MDTVFIKLIIFYFINNIHYARLQETSKLFSDYPNIDIEILGQTKQILAGIKQTHDMIDNIKENLTTKETCSVVQPVTCPPVTHDEISSAPCTVSPKVNPPYNSTWKNCADVYKSGHQYSGVFRVNPAFWFEPVDVFCDTSNGGGWTIFQRRYDGSIDFANRTWEEYKSGFGDMEKEFWLGNKFLSAMTVQNPPGYVLRIDMMNFNWETRYATYKNFRIQPESQYFKLYIGEYNGNAGDGNQGLLYNNGSSFSTVDRDHDKSGKSCAKDYAGHGGAWWHKSCSWSILNGKYVYKQQPQQNHVGWYPWQRDTPLKRSEMKFRPMDY